MIVHSFQDLKLSALGMGAMRLPVNNQQYHKIDEAATREMVAYAMEHGINYFDTAYGYHDGDSEIVMGKILEKYPRKSYYLADKFPGYDLANLNRVRDIFEEQLVKCRVDYFDFYLFHNVCEMNIDAYLDKQYGIFDYLLEQKQRGRIRHLGFSVHGSYDVMKRFLDAYGNEMEFCQIQLNYLDWSFQDAKSKIKLLEEYQIPIWVMEPLRGGKLASLHADHEEKLKALRPEESTVGWAFRFLQSIPNVVVTLSGMSDLDQLKENIAIFEQQKPLTESEWDTLLEVADNLTSQKTVPCTSCRYCTSHCPQQLDIPQLLGLYNEHQFTGGGFIAPMAMSALPEEKRPAACIQCRSCEAVCPQQIKISEALADFAEQLNA